MRTKVPMIFRRSSSSAAINKDNNHFRKQVRTYDEIPSEKSIMPASMRLLMNGGPNYLHEHCDKLHKKLGPIYREKLGAKELIFIADTKLIQIVIASEGQHPHHSIPEAWIYYNKLKGVQRGLFFQTGEPWEKLRKAFNKIMLADSTRITRFSSQIVAINDNLLEHWRDKHGQSSRCMQIEDTVPDLCKWSIETTGQILFGSRMGCLAQPTIGCSGQESGRVAEAEELVKNVSSMFHETSRFQILPVALSHRLNLRAWRRFERASSEMLRLANKYAKENLVRIKECETNSSLIKDLLNLNSLSEEEVERSVVDLIIAAADTTSNSLQWLLYLLAKYPLAQERILQEISPVFNSYSKNVNYNIREKAPYLVAFVQEALRLYPTAPFLARTLDKDITLSNYKIPAQTPIIFSLYTTSRMEQYFDNPLEFIPERWIRTGERELDISRRAKGAHASLPFGIGVRMCIGRKAAELEMYLLLASIVNKFECHLSEPDKSVQVKLRMILCPSKPIGIKLLPRKKERR